MQTALSLPGESTVPLSSKQLCTLSGDRASRRIIFFPCHNLSPPTCALAVSRPDRFPETSSRSPLLTYLITALLSYPVNAPTAEFLHGLNHAEGSDSVDKGLHRNLVALFEPRGSPAGFGFGLTVVADFVARAFGLRDWQEALGERYVGAVFDRETFRLWFHWPVAHRLPEQKLDDYHRPKESLTGF